MELFPPHTTLNNQGTNLVCCTSSQPLNFPLTPENPFTNYQTAFQPPIFQHISQSNVSGKSKRIPNWSFPGKQLIQPRTEIQTNWNTFSQNNKNISRINSNNDNRSSNAMNQFSDNSKTNWKQNPLRSSRPANQHGQPTFLPRKDADQSNRSCEKCKGSHILAT